MSEQQVYLSRWSRNSGFATGFCLFSSRDEAIKYARWIANPFVDWAKFPDPSRKYPEDDHDGTEQPELTPLFRVQWEGGRAEVVRASVLAAYPNPEAAQ